MPRPLITEAHASLVLPLSEAKDVIHHLIDTGYLNNSDAPLRYRSTYDYAFTLKLIPEFKPWDFARDEANLYLRGIKPTAIDAHAQYALFKTLENYLAPVYYEAPADLVVHYASGKVVGFKFSPDGLTTLPAGKLAINGQPVQWTPVNITADRQAAAELTYRLSRLSPEVINIALRNAGYFNADVYDRAHIRSLLDDPQGDFDAQLIKTIDRDLHNTEQNHRSFADYIRSIA